MNREGASFRNDCWYYANACCIICSKFKFGWFGGGFQKSDWWFGISPEGFGTVAMILNFITSLLIMQFHF